MTNTALTTMPAYVNEMMPMVASKELKDLFASHFVSVLESVGAGFNRISIKNSRITLAVGGKDMRTEPDFLDIIIVGISEKLYNQYFKSVYKDGGEGPPDAVWEYNTPAPANVPASALTKGTNGTYGFSTRRRLVCIAFTAGTKEQPSKPDYDTLYAFDVNAKSLFGPDRDVPNFGLGKAHGFQSYLSFIKQCRLYPIAVPVRIMIDRAESVPTVKFIPWAQNGNLMVLNEGVLKNNLAPILNKPELISMLDWRGEAMISQADTQPAAQHNVQLEPTVSAPAYVAPPSPSTNPVVTDELYQQVASIVGGAVEDANVQPSTVSVDTGIFAQQDTAPTVAVAAAEIPGIDESALDALLADATSKLAKV